MLNPDHDRLDYGQMLSPPEGCKLDFTVAISESTIMPPSENCGSSLPRSVWIVWSRIW